MSTKKPFEHLPNSVVPVNYDLLLKPDLTKFTFEGEQKITINVREETNNIVLNCNEIVISPGDVVFASGGKNVTPEKVGYSDAQETAILSFKDPLPKGEAVLSMKFTGILNDKLRGFYRSKYVAPDGNTRYIACTQFEATDARRAFPCWDEPAFKATFDISYIIPDDGKTIGLSNMNVIGEEVSAGSFKKIRFARTPIMSTYLVAFVVGEFDYLETFSQDGVRVRVYTPLGKKEQGQFGLEVCAKSLDYYREYFKIAYPLNKMDLIAIPDFASGAMENWGLVTYRETCLLVDPDNSSTLRKQYVALVVAHELAHQWFGNLVTMEWWTHLWLNEGFASFIEHLCVDNLFPKFNIWTQFVSDTFLEAMEADGLDNSHPIEVPVGHPSEVDEIFDNISYNKGASVIRMLYNFIGDEAFRKGMNLYLSRHSYKNTVTEQLWDALEEASQKPVRRVMSTWTKQKGYPIISVSSTTSDNKTVVNLQQQKFRMAGELSGEDAKMLWSVPLQIISSSSTKKPIVNDLMEKAEMSLSLTLGPNEWFKLNPSAVCTYRVRYSPELLAKFIPAIKDGSLPPLDRLSLLDDLFAMVLAGKSKTVDLLKFLSAFENETDYTVWRALSNCLGKLDQLFSGSEFHYKFRNFGRNLLNKTVFPQIGWSAKPDEPYLDTLLRPLVIGRLVSFRDESVLAEFKRRFNEHLAGKLIPADLRAAAYKSMAIQADEAVFNQLLELYNKAELQEEKNRVSTSLGATQNPEFIKRVLEFAISDKVRSQDSISVIAHLAFNPAARDAAWAFFQEKKAFFSARYESGFLLSHLVKSVTENFTTEARAKEIEKFFQENQFPGSERSVQQSIETIRLNAAILQRDSKDIAQFFEK